MPRLSLSEFHNRSAEIVAGVLLQGMAGVADGRVAEPAGAREELRSMGAMAPVMGSRSMNATRNGSEMVESTTCHAARWPRLRGRQGGWAPTPGKARACGGHLLSYTSDKHWPSDYR